MPTILAKFCPRSQFWLVFSFALKNWSWNELPESITVHHISVPHSLCFLLDVRLLPIDWVQFALYPFEDLLLQHFQLSQSHVMPQMRCKVREWTACADSLCDLPPFSTLQSGAISRVQWQLILLASYARNIHYSCRSLKHGLRSRCRKRTKSCQLSR